MESDEQQVKGQRNSNLARIRDNQRRSRARRKEYVQELEAKYRVCQQSGVEASAEIQAAARKVVDENKRLRHLLKQRGLSDAEIDSLPTDPPENSIHSTSATALEGMLGGKKPCGPGKRGNEITSRQPCCPPVTSQQTYQSSSRQPSASASVSPVIMSAEHASLQSSMATVVPATHAMQLPLREPSATLSATRETTYQTVLDDGIPFDEALDWSDLFPPTRPSPEHLKPALHTGTTEFSSCYAAADAIRRINPALGYELEEALGCCDGSDCEVPNGQVFDTMERYMDDS